MGSYLSMEPSDSPLRTPNSNSDRTATKELRLSRCQLPFDPRSPTDNIARTPIVVDNYPDELVNLDPRSPTLGIERTPLSALLGKDISTESNAEREMETSSPPPLFLPPVDTMDDETLTPPKHVLEVTDIGASPILECAAQPKMRTPEPTPMQPKPSKIPKMLFPVKQQHPPPQKQTLISRQAFGLVQRDTNSPRNIVQNKQRKQVAKTMGGIAGQQSIDKENIVR